MLVVDTDLEQYLTQVLDQSTNGVIISDPNQDGNPVIFVNQTTCDTFEYKRSDFLGRNCSFLQGKDKDQAGLKGISAAIKKRVPVTVTLRNYTKSGTLIYNQITVSPIFDKEKNLKYFLGIQRDITKEILLQQENKALQEEKIDNAQYNAIGKLSAGLSHEINTPLTIIKGSMEMLKSSIDALENTAEKEYMIEDFSSIQDNFNRIKNITESMREIADAHQFQIKNMNLYRAIIIALRLTYNKSKNIVNVKIQDEFFNLDIDRDSKQYFIQGDSQKLEQAFIAIIDNALDQLEVKGTLEENILNISIVENENNYELTFQDNGGGVDSSLLPNIFKPFNSDKKHRGLGIGLSVVKKIMDEHQFNISFQNHNNGVKVSISINK